MKVLLRHEENCLACQGALYGWGLCFAGRGMLRGFLRDTNLLSWEVACRAIGLAPFTLAQYDRKVRGP